MPFPKIIRSDVLRDRKCIHIQLEKSVHAQLRVAMFKYNLSMQEVFNEFANMIVSEEGMAGRVLERVAHRKMQAILEGRPKNERGVDKLDSEDLYNLIEGRGRKKE